MKKPLLIAALLTTCISFGQPKPKLTDEQKFNQCVSVNTNYFTFDGQRPNGKGWTIMESLFAENQFVAWGEYHNSPIVSQLTTLALENAAKQGFKTWCIETSPFVAKELMQIARTKNPADSLISLSKTHPDYSTFPFFKTKEDAQMLVSANEFKYTILGVDQEFQRTFPYCMTKVYDAQSSKLKVQYKPVYDSLMIKWWMPNDKLLDSLKNAVSQPDFKEALEDIKTSKKIYIGNDNGYDNLLRASLMKRNFFNHYDNSKVKNEKVFFKMGSNHLAKGMNLETHIYDIGNAVFELSQRNKTSFANVYFMVRYSMEEGKIIDDMEADKPENPKVFSKMYDKEKWVLVDVRTLRERIRNDNTLTIDTYKLIEKYDFVLVSPEILK